MTLLVLAMNDVEAHKIEECLNKENITFKPMVIEGAFLKGQRKNYVKMYYVEEKDKERANEAISSIDVKGTPKRLLEDEDEPKGKKKRFRFNPLILLVVMAILVVLRAVGVIQ